MQAPPEKLAYLAMVHPDKKEAPDALGVVDVDPDSSNYGQIVGQVDMPNNGDELHHFGWNACSSCLCPYAPHPHMERRYLIVPGIDSSRIHILDTKARPPAAENREGHRAEGIYGANRLHGTAYDPLRT